MLLSGTSDDLDVPMESIFRDIKFKIANNVYKSGFKKNQKLIDMNEPEQYAIEKNDVYYLYANIRGINENEGNFRELFEIVDKKHEDAATKQALIQEKND